MSISAGWSFEEPRGAFGSLITCDQHPDHNTPASFRRRFGEQFTAVFVQGLQVAR